VGGGSGEREIASLTRDPAKLAFVAEAGNTYFISQEVTMYGGSRLRQVDEATGRAGVRECRLIQSQL
jgi:hypothetical protein